MSDRTPAKKGGILSRVSFMQWIALVLVVLAVIFVLLNREHVSVNFFGVTVSAPQWLTLILVFAVGWLTGVFTMRRRHAAPKA
ncbi:LapA family protein [Rhodococcus sp. D2-41]|uniref:LapA family protein n=1 Tax=Speluncibacter jeojiensis TaxID=2710754 RepID=A0A9X4M225_9ACTN|nr:LapA family protein [Rhodococcus sp. D2-41]MDG3009475.1 LapA family protein [Rhodococcus sp. D2-41]MDG3016404.1 LapA family protein [Corynebacteriales bacterium D3-21]